MDSYRKTNLIFGGMNLVSFILNLVLGNILWTLINGGFAIFLIYYGWMENDDSIN